MRKPTIPSLGIKAAKIFALLGLLIIISAYSSIGYAEKHCTHPDTFIEWDKDLNGNDIIYEECTNLDENAYVKSGEGEHYYIAQKKGVCKYPGCGANKILTLAHGNFPHTFDEYDPSEEGKYNCTKCIAYTYKEHECKFTKKLPETKQYDRTVQIEGNSEKHKVFSSYEYQCVCEKKDRISKENDYELKPHNTGEKEPILEPTEDCEKISETFHARRYIAKYECKCGYPVVTDYNYWANHDISHITPVTESTKDCNYINGEQHKRKKTVTYKCECGFNHINEIWDPEEHEYTKIVPEKSNDPATIWSHIRTVMNNEADHYEYYTGLKQCDCGLSAAPNIHKSEWCTPRTHTKDINRIETYNGVTGHPCTHWDKGCRYIFPLSPEDGTPYCDVYGHDWQNEPLAGTHKFQLNKFIISLFIGNARADTGYNKDVLQRCRNCKKTNCEIYGHSWSVATCTTPKRCTRCKKTDGDKRGHTYDYSHPENTSAYTIRFPCIYGCAGAYDTHSHSFVDAGEDAVKTDNLQKSNDTHHKRRYDIRQVCNSKLGNGAICGAPNWRYDWRNENHSFANNGSEVKTSTLRTLNASQHERKYTQAKKCACGQSTTVETWKKENHSFANNGSEVKTSTLRKLNASQHERKYTQAQKCACGQSTTVETWKKETHTFVNNGSETKTNTTRTVNASQHERKYTQAQKCTCGETKTVEKWYKETHSWHNDAVSKVATCTAQGSRTRMCAVCNYVDTYPTAIDPNNHNWSGEPKCLTGASCTNGCGATKPALGHNYSGWTLVRTPTATDRGQLKRTCYRCGQAHYKPAR